MLVEELVVLLSAYSSSGLKAYLPEWRQLNCVLDRPVVMHLADRYESGVARDVTEDGLLLLELPDGSRKAYASGEVRLRVADARPIP
ncbi:hypothetical protein [Methylogaea oryzae]|uniref:hypothetical protein n=1 Tax=Methylogaea oryzae TaxID=1295382 RepID=UPI00138F4255|nr:hypothetical protein [Methylogaea oryzae]